jgi:hypothetical protein
MTYRDRRMAKAERLRAWAEKREQNASAVLAAGEPYRGTWAFATQPGHIPLRARVIAREERAFESLRKAREMAARADNIEAAAEHAIYADDPDAIERLEERIAQLEAERERIKAENAAFRKAHRTELAAMTPYQRDQAMPYRGYVLQNLTGNIARNRQRLDGLRRKSV